jgi:hypothetical protein
VRVGPIGRLGRYPATHLRDALVVERMAAVAVAWSYATACPAYDLPVQGRSEAVIDTGLEYRPGDPVRVRVVRREHRISVTDDGAAIAQAGRPHAWREAADLVGELGVNVSRRGVVSLPVVPVGPCEERTVRRIGEASLCLYQAILEREE